MLAEDLSKVLDAIIPKSRYAKYDESWRANGTLVEIERRGRKFRIVTHWPSKHISSWLIPESALKRLAEKVPEIATKLANPTVDFSKDK